MHKGFPNSSLSANRSMQPRSLEMFCFSSLPTTLFRLIARLRIMILLHVAVNRVYRFSYDCDVQQNNVDRKGVNFGLAILDFVACRSVNGS
jgi:hypothetical protein